MRCTQIAAVCDTMEVVGLLFFLCSYVRQIADPSLSSNLNDFVCMAWRPDTGLGASDSRFLISPRRRNRDLAIYLKRQCPRLGETPPLRVQGPRLGKALIFEWQ